jgi:hypothetical protein
MTDRPVCVQEKLIVRCTGFLLRGGNHLLHHGLEVIILPRFNHRFEQPEYVLYHDNILLINDETLIIPVVQ